MAWMAGAYVEFKLSDDLILDLKGLWGKSSNEIGPFLTYTDTFETTRWLVSARLTGSWKSGNWHFSPRAEIVGYQDRQHGGSEVSQRRARGGVANSWPTFLISSAGICTQVSAQECTRSRLVLRSCKKIDAESNA